MVRNAEYFLSDPALLSINDATAAVRLLMGRNDIAIDQTENDLMVKKGLPAVITKENANHRIGDICYERVPVVVGKTLAFVEPVTHDLVLKSRQSRCAWKKSSNIPEIFLSNALYHLTKDERSVVLNTTKPSDLSSELIELVLDCLDQK
ncbi:unnamed protein product [Toxocara canis]|uniref:Type II toxin-antitoxin system PemK/MazF family toxin n=1 Tax=Toxocara canis TaxID=6265 RepID=A0A183UY18_TOXCA|nr:unnamed protein product [Toxocara canis]